MKLLNRNLPHISRLFTAQTISVMKQWSVRFIMWTLLIALIGFNIGMRGTTIVSNPPFIQILLNTPLSPSAHKQLATIFWNQGAQSEAHTEAVLGAQTSNGSLLIQWDTQQQSLRQSLNFWNTVIKQKPSYRDAYIQAADAAVTLGDMPQAIKLLGTALELDPNNSATKKLLNEIQNSGK